MSLLRSTNQVPSIQEDKNICRYIDNLLDTLSPEAVNELLQGFEQDLDEIFDIFYQETDNVLNLKNTQNSGVKSTSLDYLPKIQSGYEHFLRCQSLAYFTQTCLPNFDLQWFHLEWMSMIQIYQYLCIIASRDHSKSYTFSFAHILWKLYRYEAPSEFYIPRREIQLCKEGMLITNEFNLAKKLLKKVRTEIEMNDTLKERLLPQKLHQDWGNTALVCKNGAEVTIGSFNSGVRGPHPGWIVVDDFLDSSALYSKEQRERFHEIFFAEIMNAVLPGGTVDVVGTPFHKEDLYHELENDAAWKVFYYPAIFPDGTILYEERYNYESLVKKRKSLGVLIFSREILCRPISDDVSIFPWSILENAFINMQSMRLVTNRLSYPIKLIKVAIGCDFALSANVGADYTVYSVVGFDELYNIHLLASERLHGATYNEQIAVLKGLEQRFSPEAIVMEVNNFQKVMMQVAKEHNIKNIIPFNTTGFNKKDLMEGLPSLAVMFETGIIKFPRGDEYSKEITDLYCSELNSIAFDDEKGKLQSVGEHDDTTMSLFFGIKGLKYVNTGISISTVEMDYGTEFALRDMVIDDDNSSDPLGLLDY